VSDGQFHATSDSVEFLNQSGLSDDILCYDENLCNADVGDAPC